VIDGPHRLDARRGVDHRFPSGAALKAEIPTLTPEEWAEFIDPLESLEPHIEERETA
jgi:hypothetical protein